MMFAEKLKLYKYVFQVLKKIATHSLHVDYSIVYPIYMQHATAFT